jgi:hypothetical protein
MTDAALQLPAQDVTHGTRVWPFSIWSGKKQSREDEMLGLFLSMLDVRAQGRAANIGQDAFSQGVFTELKNGISKLQSPEAGTSELSNPAAWNEAYRLERLLALIEPPDTLTQEVDRRLNEAIAKKLTSVERLTLDVSSAKSNSVDNSQTPPALTSGGLQRLRSALINLLEELHWDDQRKFYATPIQRDAVQRIVFLDLIAFAGLVAPFFWIYYKASQVSVDPGVPPPVPGVDIVNLGTWAWLPAYIVIMSGAFGAYFSRLIDILRNGDTLSIRELQNSKSVWSLFLRGAVGMCGALVVFFFLKSGLITGGVFPDFTKLGFDFINYRGTDDNPAQAAVVKEVMLIIEPSKALALLVLWSFIAGFSERLVPTILANTETSFTNSASGVGGKTNN